MNCEKEVNGLVNFIKEEVTGAGKDACVVGVSGGIDSAVIASLCKIAFPDTTYGISMPISANSESTWRAFELCEKINIQIHTHLVTVEPLTFGLANRNYGRKARDCVYINDKVKGNYLARQRMATLYAYAEMLNGLVIGTDNLSENYIGYFTKYGDGGVDINPIGKYFKSEVYELAKYLNVPDSIINAVPSAELWEGQTDEGELGFSYDDLEKFIKVYVYEDHKILEEIPEEIQYKIWDMAFKSSHKRNTSKEYHRGDCGRGI